MNLHETTPVRARNCKISTVFRTQDAETQPMARRKAHPRTGVRSRLAGAAGLVALGTAFGWPAPASAASPLDGNGMWVWYVSQSGGSAAAIARKATKRHIDTVLVKSGDGDTYWDQFTPELVDTLHDAGRRVCAWQYVYGSRPRAEARTGAKAVDAGADCLVIDAESRYEGRYKAADRYIDELRDRVGEEYPVALASFPYVDYHPSFPYSVFLGKHGAQYNVPQMYWKTIGTSVGKIYKHTYEVNAPYDRPIFPLGQTYLHVSRKSVLRFRRNARQRGAAGVSWWSWQETKGREWRWVGKSLNRHKRRTRDKREAAAAAGPRADYAPLGSGDAGDLVVWAQELLRAHGRAVAVDGSYDDGMASAVRALQAAHGLAPTGSIDDRTWARLLTREPKPVAWSRRPGPAAPAGAPDSASLDALRAEVPLTPGRP